MNIITDRLLLRDFTEADAPKLIAYHSDARYLEFYASDDSEPTRVRELLDTFISWSMECPRQKYQLAIATRGEAGHLLGTCGLRLEDATAPTADFGIELAPPHWGHGYAMEAAQGILAFGFRELNLEVVRGTAVSGNVRVAALARRLGFASVGTTRGDPWMTRRGWHQQKWELTRSSWSTQKAAM